MRLPVLIFLAAFTVVLWGMSQAQSFLVPLCLAALLAFLAAPLVRALRRARVSESVAITLGALMITLPVLGILFAVVDEGQNLIHDWPAINASVRQGLIDLQASQIGQRFHLSRYLSASELSSRIGTEAGAGVKIVIMGLRSILEAGSKLLLVLFFAIVMLASRAHLRHYFEELLASHPSIQASETLDQVAELIQRFLMARVAIVVLVAVVDLIILKAFDISYAILMASFLGLMTLVPLVGFFLGIIPPLLFSVVSGHGSLYLIGLFLAIGTVSSIQDHLLTPKLIGSRLNLNFLMTYLAIFAGERLWGAWGMFLSIPILGVLRIGFSASPRTRVWGDLLSERRERAGPSKKRGPFVRG